MKQKEKRAINNMIRKINQEKIINFDKVEMSLVAGRKPMKEKYKGVELKFDI